MSRQAVQTLLEAVGHEMTEVSEMKVFDVEITTEVAKISKESGDLCYQCPHCGSKSSQLIHQDVFAELDVILCGDCDEEHTVYAGTDIWYE